MGVLNNKRIRKFYRSIGYTIRPPSKLYEDNQEIIKIDLEDRITKQSRPFNVFITAIHEHQFSNFFRWWTQDQTCNFLTSTPKKWRPKSNGYD